MAGRGRWLLVGAIAAFGSTTIGLATTGRILGAGTARQMQFALKFIF